ncbi:toprim domain-containing protein [Calidithermus chliarophilus]|uniref:toprim domain-containing protein n=1 Tax=Calidithermus chliarophilus TaxID=52023 RepID=UPI00041D0245|nr:toprim domain-containing protein [Calidithermus chliarophilus]
MGPYVDILLERLHRVHPTGPGRWMALCPAHPDRKPSLSIRVLDDKILLHCFAGCDGDAVLGALGLEWRDLYADTARPWEAPGYYRPAPAPATPEGERVARWGRWWSSATPGHPLLRAYLRARGLSLTPPPTLRLAVWGGTPLVLARVEHPTHGLVGLHATELLPDGSGRVSKRLAAGSKPMGGAIRLYEHQLGQPLALAEGVETALAVHQSTGWPCWACVSAGGLERVQLPAEAREVVICADHDRAGLEAARKLARRLLAEGRKVRLAIPPKPGLDWLDVVAGEVAR